MIRVVQSIDGDNRTYKSEKGLVRDQNRLHHLSSTPAYMMPKIPPTAFEIIQRESFEKITPAIYIRNPTSIRIFAAEIILKSHIVFSGFNCIRVIEISSSSSLRRIRRARIPVINPTTVNKDFVSVSAATLNYLVPSIFQLNLSVGSQKPGKLLG